MPAVNEYRYTDRDVRSNPDFHAIVTEYLEQYTGEFEFLVDMKMRLGAGYKLSVGMVRGVLNCMRNDPRATGLPEPSLGDVMAEVIAIPRRNKKIKPVPIAEVCPLDGTEHNRHWFDKSDGSQQHCLGWHAINREIVRTRARFHRPYLRGSQSNLIHRSNREGEITWFPEVHGTGMAEPTFYRVPTQCPIQWLKNPEMLTGDEVRAAEAYTYPTASKKYPEITLCSRCFPVGDASLERSRW